MEKSPVTPTLGTQIKRRRAQLRIRPTAAARAAHVARSTWAAWENDENVPADVNWPVIEAVCRWAEGSVAAILDGREPTPLGDDHAQAHPGADPADDDRFIRQLRAMNLTPKKFEAIVTAYRQDLAREVEQRAREDAALQEKYLRIAEAVSE